MLYRTAKRLTKNEVEAEDLVGQALLKAAKAWDRFDGQYVRSWLIRIMRNEHLNNRRAEASRPVEAELDENVSQAASVWDEVNWRLAGDRIAEELDGLSEEFRTTIQLCDVEQMSYEEAAEAMEIPVGTVRSRLFRARRQLRDRLADLALEGAR